MKVKPKDIAVNLPIVLYFDNADEYNSFASNFNTLIHGKVKMKYDVLGELAGKQTVLFYLQRNDEYHELRDSFRVMIENEEISNHASKQTDAMFCDHANEVPLHCTCNFNCYCKSHTCKRRNEI